MMVVLEFSIMRSDDDATHSSPWQMQAQYPLPLATRELFLVAPQAAALSRARLLRVKPPLPVCLAPSPAICVSSSRALGAPRSRSRSSFFNAILALEDKESPGASNVTRRIGKT